MIQCALYNNIHTDDTVDTRHLKWAHSFCLLCTVEWPNEAEVNIGIIDVVVIWFFLLYRIPFEQAFFDVRWIFSVCWVNIFSFYSTRTHCTADINAAMKLLFTILFDSLWLSLLLWWFVSCSLLLSGRTNRHSLAFCGNSSAIKQQHLSLIPLIIQQIFYFHFQFLSQHRWKSSKNQVHSIFFFYSAHRYHRRQTNRFSIWSVKKSSQSVRVHSAVNQFRLKFS